MKLPPVRFTVRSMMAAVAVVALVLWTGRLLWLSATYLARVRKIKPRIEAPRTSAWGRERPPVISRPSARLIWARAMANKYQCAAWHPWLSVEPDSPPPPK